MKLLKSTALLLLAAFSATADDLDDLLGSFDIEDTIATPEAALSDDRLKQDFWFGGSLNVKSQYNFEPSELTSVRTGIDLQGNWQPKANLKFYGEISAEYDFYDQNSAFNSIEIDEMYVRWTFTESSDFYFGRQIVTWGKSDAIRVNDIVNPLDRREPGIIDVDDNKLPVLMSQLNYYSGNWQTQAIVIHESRMNEFPSSESDFYPYPISNVSFDLPENGWQDFNQHQYGLTLQHTSSQRDIGLYVANIYDQNGNISITPSSVSAPTANVTFERVAHIGAGYAGAFGNWGVKIDGAYRKPEHSAQHALSMFGIDYSGWDDTTWTIELGNTYTPDSVNDESQFQLATRYSRTFYNERLEANVLASLAEEIGGLSRWNLYWHHTDDIKLEGGVLFYYESNAALFKSDNNRLYAKLAYYF
jgi:hypothetical protein